MGLTRKEIQEDRIRVILTKLSEWILVNQKILLTGLAVSVLIVMAVWAWTLHAESRDRAAQVAFAAALDIYNGRVDLVDASRVDGETPPPPPPVDDGRMTFATEAEKTAKAIEGFEAVIADHSGTSVEGWARYYLALTLDESGEENTAQEILTELSEGASLPLLRNQASERLAENAEKSGRNEDASRYLNKIAEAPAPNYPLQSIILRLAQAYEKSGDTDAAIDQYRRLQDEYPTSDEATEAERKLTKLAPEPSDTSESADSTPPPSTRVEKRTLPRRF